MHSSKLRLPLLQSAELDDNRDGKTDRLELIIQMPLSHVEHIYNFNALVCFKVKFNSKVKYIFDAVSLINYNSAVSLGHLFVDGDLILRQNKVLSSKGGFVLSTEDFDHFSFCFHYRYRIPYEGDSLFDSSGRDFNTASIAHIMQKNSARDCKCSGNSMSLSDILFSIDAFPKQLRIARPPNCRCPFACRGRDFPAVLQRHHCGAHSGAVCQASCDERNSSTQW